MNAQLIQCRKFEIIDEFGQPRIVLSADAGQASILLLGRNGVRLQISTTENNPVEIHLMDSGEGLRASLGVFGNGQAGLTVFDSAGRPVAILGSEQESDTGVVWHRSNTDRASPESPPCVGP